MTALTISMMPNLVNSVFLSQQKLRSTMYLDKVGSIQCFQFINSYKTF